MRAILKVLMLAIAVMAVTGCGGHYALDKYIDRSQLAGSNEPNAIKVYVGKHNFNDGTGHSLQLTRSVAEGEISPWIKKSLIDVIGNIRFVDSQNRMMQT